MPTFYWIGNDGETGAIEGPLMVVKGLLNRRVVAKIAKTLDISVDQLLS